MSPSTNAQTFPADNDWTPLTLSGAILTDAALDMSVVAPARDIVGDTNHPAALVASDCTFLYLRMRVSSSPSGAFGWGFQISSDGIATGYEYMVLLDGKASVAVGLEVWLNTVKTNSPSDTAETLHAQHPLATFTRIAAAADGLGFFLDMAAPWSDLGNPPSTPLQFVLGTNANAATPLSTGSGGDVAGQGMTALLSWSQLATDAVTFPDAVAPAVTAPADAVTTQTTCE